MAVCECCHGDASDTLAQGLAAARACSGSRGHDAPALPRRRAPTCTRHAEVERARHCEGDIDGALHLDHCRWRLTHRVCNFYQHVGYGVWRKAQERVGSKSRAEGESRG